MNSRHKSEAAGWHPAAGASASDDAQERPHYITERAGGQLSWGSYVERVREATDFPALVEETVGSLPHRVDGRPAMVRCPWHDDHNPSLAAYADHAHCFGCGWHGDCFAWVMRRDDVDFRTALDELARRAGIPSPRWTPEEEKAAQERRVFEDALAVAAQHFVHCLQDSTAGLAYAHERGWSDETIRAEGLGYANGGPLPDLGHERARRMAEALNRWAGRVGGAVVYVHREGGRVVYLTGRSIEGKHHYNPPRDLAGEQRSYLNAPYCARAEEVIVVEGQADAVTLSGWGFPAVALGGSGLTRDLAARLKRHVGRGATLYVVPDTDGKTDVAGLAEAVGPLLRVVALPAGVADVNDYARRGATVEGFRALLEGAPTWVALMAEQVAALGGAKRQEALRALFARLASLDRFTLADHRERVSELLKITTSQFNRYLNAVRDEAAAERRNGRNSDRYVVESGCLCAVRFGRDGDRYSEPLCNFVAEVVEDVAHDDGEEVIRQFTVSGRLADGRPLPTVRVDAARFTAMGWVNDVWGVQAVVRAGWRTKDQLREAIQLRSDEAVSRHVYTHTGWREVEGRRVYLSAGGALGLEGVAVELDRELDRYRLPHHPRGAREAVQASLRFLEIAPDTITVPLWAAVYLAPLTEIVYPAFTIWLYGVTGTLKSTTAALALSHYGAFTDRDLFLWTDTANRLEKTCFLAKDALLVIDDFAPASDPYKAREMERNAARIVRNVGNRGGRGRLTSDLRLRTIYRPRGLVVSTGEQIPDGQSVMARTFTVEMRPGDVDLDRLTAAQAEAGRYPHALAGYLLWIADQWDRLAETLPQARLDLRTRLLTKTGHLRIPDTLATLYLGLDLGLAYAVEVGALTETEAGSWRERGWSALCIGAEAQARRVERERPTVRFLEVLAELLAQGRVRLEARDGEGIIGGDAVGAELLGWYDDDYLYLLPGVSYNRVARFLRDEGAHFPVKERTLRKHLVEEGYLAREGDRYTDVLRVGEKTYRVLRLYRAKVESFIGLSLSKTGNTGNIGNIGNTGEVPF